MKIIKTVLEYNTNPQKISINSTVGNVTDSSAGISYIDVNGEENYCEKENIGIVAIYEEYFGYSFELFSIDSDIAEMERKIVSSAISILKEKIEKMDGAITYISMYERK